MLEILIRGLQKKIGELEARIKELEEHPREACDCTKSTG